MLWYSIRKHGKHHHVCEILEHYFTRDWLREREAELVNENVLSDPLCMNMRLGGNVGYLSESSPSESYGFLNYEIRKDLAPIIAAIKKQKKLDDPIYAARMKENEAKASKLAADAVMEKYGVKSWFSIMNVDPVFKEKRKERLKELQHQQGEKNSQFGTCWVSSKEEQRSIKIPKDQLNNYIGLGWHSGRKL